MVSPSVGAKAAQRGCSIPMSISEAAEEIDRQIGEKFARRNSISK
jgi:hypothetical protein